MKFIPTEQLRSIQFHYTDDPKEQPFIHIGLKSLIVDGDRLRQGQLVEFPVPPLGVSAQFSIFSTHKSPKGVDVIGGFLISD